jgi:hypothetical protein
VLNDFGRVISKRVGLAAVILRGRNPAHDPEAAHVIDVRNVHAVERKVFKIYPILAVGMTYEVELATLSHLRRR